MRQRLQFIFPSKTCLSNWKKQRIYKKINWITKLQLNYNILTKYLQNCFFYYFFSIFPWHMVFLFINIKLKGWKDYFCRMSFFFYFLLIFNPRPFRLEVLHGRYEHPVPIKIASGEWAPTPKQVLSFNKGREYSQRATSSF